MNRNQKRYLIGIGFLLLTMLLFPPWMISSEGTIAHVGYAFIFYYNSPPPFITVNVTLLLVQWLFVCTIGFIGWYVLRNDK